RLAVRRGVDFDYPEWTELPTVLRVRFGEAIAADGAAKVAAVLSPFMSCEEAFLLATFIRNIAPQATLAMGPVPTSGEDQKFPVGQHNGKPPTFVIHAEKCPNRRGVELVLKGFGGEVISFDEFTQRASKGSYNAAWISGPGFRRSWQRPRPASDCSYCTTSCRMS